MLATGPSPHGTSGRFALPAHLVDGEHASIQQRRLPLHPVVLVLLQRLDGRQVELHRQLRVAEAGQQHPVQLFFQEPHLRHHGVAPEHALRRLDVGVGGPLEVAQQQLGHPVGPAHLLQAPAQTLDEVDVPVGQAQRLHVAHRRGHRRPVGVGRTLVAHLPAGVELLQFRLVHLLVGQQQEVGARRVAQQVPVEAQPLVSHVGGEPRRRQRRQAGQLLQRVEVAQPHDLVGRVRHRLGDPAVYEPAHVPPPVRQHGDAVGTQGPQLRLAVIAPLDGPEGRAPQAQVGLRRPPQVGAGVPRVDPVQQARHRMRRLHRRPAPAGLSGAVHPQRRSGQGVGAQLDGRVHRRRRRHVPPVLRTRPAAPGVGRQAGQPFVRRQPVRQRRPIGPLHHPGVRHVSPADPNGAQHLAQFHHVCSLLILSESGFSGFWDSQDCCNSATGQPNPENPQIQ